MYVCVIYMYVCVICTCMLMRRTIDRGSSVEEKLDARRSSACSTSDMLRACSLRLGGKRRRSSGKDKGRAYGEMHAGVQWGRDGASFGTGTV